MKIVIELGTFKTLVKETLSNQNLIILSSDGTSTREVRVSVA